VIGRGGGDDGGIGFDARGAHGEGDLVEDGGAETLETALGADGGGSDVVGEELEGEVGGLAVGARGAELVETAELASTSIQGDAGRKGAEFGDRAFGRGDVLVDEGHPRVR